MLNAMQHPRRAALEHSFRKGFITVTAAVARTKPTKGRLAEIIPRSDGAALVIALLPLRCKREIRAPGRPDARFSLD